MMYPQTTNAIACFFWLHRRTLEQPHLPHLFNCFMKTSWFLGKKNVKPLSQLLSIECQTTAQARRAATAGKFWSFLNGANESETFKAFHMVHSPCLNKGCIELLSVTPIFNLPSYQAFALCFLNSS